MTGEKVIIIFTAVCACGACASFAIWMLLSIIKTVKLIINGGNHE